MGFLTLEYDAIKSKISRNINKQLPPNVTKFDKIHTKSKYYKIVRNESFMIFKNSNLTIFQYPFQVKLYMKIYLKMVLYILHLNLLIKCSLLVFLLNI